MNVAIRVDASATLGFGHVMRCRALAAELLRRGASITYICQALPGTLRVQLESSGARVLEIGRGSESDFRKLEDADQSVAALEQLGLLPDWLVVDHYALDADWERRLRGYSKKVMVIDDLADRPHDCDLLLDQNWYENADVRYRGRVSEGCTRLLGPRYALLSEQFARARRQSEGLIQGRKGQVKRLLIAFGGGDPGNESGKSLTAVERLIAEGRSFDGGIDLVVGASNPHAERLRAHAESIPGVRYHFQSTELHQLMLEADLAIGAGGTMTWERCCLGLASLTISIAENQREVSEALAGLGCHLYLGPSERIDVATVYRALLTLLDAPGLLSHFSKAGTMLVDGQGAVRVARELMPLSIALRPATLDDAALLHTWRNAPENRKHFFETGEIPFVQHLEWMSHVLSDPGRILLVAESSGREVGALRFDIEGTVALVSIYLAPSEHGKGVGTQALRAGAEWMRMQCREVEVLRGEVLPGNVASRRAFLGAGYSERNIVFEKCLR